MMPYVIVDISPILAKDWIFGEQFPMCGLNCLPVTDSTFMSLYRLTWASQLLLTRLVSTSHVSLARLRTSNEHSYQLHLMNPLSSDDVWPMTPVPFG